MLQIQLLRQNKELVLAGLKKKNFKEPELVDAIIALDEQRRRVQVESDELASKVNAASKNIGQLMGQGKKDEAEQLKTEVAQYKEKTKELTQKLADLEAEQHNLMVKLPNMPHDSVPAGKAAEDNITVREAGATPDLSAQKLPHWELAARYNLIDFELGNKITGAGFPVYIGQGAKLQRALISYFLDYNIAAGYKEYYPPHMVNEASAYGTGSLPDKEGQMYYMPADDLYMIPTSEIPITNIYRDEIINNTDLPIKMTGYSPCFRREAGSYGKDVRGLNRVHQFDKVEIVQIVHPDTSYDVQEQMVAHVENLLTSLGLQHRVLLLCGGDMTFASSRTYDLEVYSAAQERWLEVSSVSNFETFQANRMKIRYRDENGKAQIAHTLNGSSLALPRIMACIMENHQTPEGIKIPPALVPYFGKNIIN